MGDDEETVTLEDIEAAREEVIEAMARIAEAYGAKRSHGRLYGILYFADGPMSMDALVAESSYAKSTVSTAMSALERFSLVRRRSQPDEGKRVFFEPREDFQSVFQQFLDQHLRRELDQFGRSLEAAGMVLDQGTSDRATRDRQRVAALERSLDSAEDHLDALTSHSPDTLSRALDSLDEK